MYIRGWGDMNVWQKLCATGLLPEGISYAQTFHKSLMAPHSKTVSPSTAPSGGGIRKTPPEGQFLLDFL
jgi:hypothetical protein